MIKPNLWQKLAAVIAALMLMCCMAGVGAHLQRQQRHAEIGRAHV